MPSLIPFKEEDPHLVALIPILGNKEFKKML